MTQKIKIPKTIEEATTSLGGIGALLQAKEWERAALVYAFTRDGDDSDKNPETRRSTSTTSLLPREFAELGIVGLKSDRTVREYRKAWQSAMDDGAPDVRPGDVIDTPHLPWPPGFIEQRRGSHATKVEEAQAFTEILKDPQRLREVVDTPEAADALIDVVTEPGLRHRAEAKLRDKREQEDQERAARVGAFTRPTPPREVVEKVIKAVDSFFRTTLVHNGQTLTYEDVIDEVVATGRVPELGAVSITPHWLGEDLSQALEAMCRTATTKVQALGSGQTLAIGAREIDG